MNIGKARNCMLHYKDSLYEMSHVPWVGDLPRPKMDQSQTEWWSLRSVSQGPVSMRGRDVGSYSYQVNKQPFCRQYLGHNCVTFWCVLSVDNWRVSPRICSFIMTV